MIRYRVILSNSAGELDSFTSTDLATAAEELSHLLQNHNGWVLAAGDTIRIVEASYTAMGLSGLLREAV